MSEFSCLWLITLKEQYRLVQATSESDDPVTLLQQAGHEYVPVDPSVPQIHPKTNNAIVPSVTDRPSVESVLAVMRKQPWFKDQIVDRKAFDAKAGRTGMCVCYHTSGNRTVKYSYSRSTTFARDFGSIEDFSGYHFPVFSSGHGGRSRGVGETCSGFYEYGFWQKCNLSDPGVEVFGGDT